MTNMKNITNCWRWSAGRVTIKHISNNYNTFLFININNDLMMYFVLSVNVPIVSNH